MNYENVFADFLNAFADDARAIALRYFRTDLHVEEKDDLSPVTLADREIENLFRQRVAAHFPDHGITGEEFDETGAGAEFSWVIDPIDGTKSFAVGRPLFGTVVGLMHHGAPVGGLLDQAFTGERWIAFKGVGAFMNGKKISAAPPRPLHRARSFFSSPAIYGAHWPRVKALTEQTLWPHFGCDCYAYGLLAQGTADLVVESNLKWHDIAGVLNLISEAGGHVQDWSGTMPQPGWDGTLIAASDPALAAVAADFLIGETKTN